MDKFLTVTKYATSSSGSSKGSSTTRKQFKYNPYPIPKSKEKQIEAFRDKKRVERILAPLNEEMKHSEPTSSKALTKHLLNTLKDDSNPITHSKSGQRLDHVDSCATGHQRSDLRRSSSQLQSRARKLEAQRQETGKHAYGVLKGVNVYIGGYMAGTTDIEMKRVVTLAGGSIVNSAARATHILTSQGLSGAKTHRYLHNNLRNKAHIVTPEWVLDSISAGKRKKEWDYTVIKDSTMYKLEEFGAGLSRI